MSTVEIKDLVKESDLTAEEMKDIRGGEKGSIDLSDLFREASRSINVGETLRTGTLVLS